MVLRVDVEASASELAQEMSLLLELRESAAVPRLAAARLAALVGAAEHRVLRVFPVAVARVADAPSDYAVAADSIHGDAAPVALGDDADLLEAIRGRRPVQRDGRLLVPLSAGDEVRHVVELVGAGALARGAALAAALLPLAAAYYELLADAETDPLTRLANGPLFYS